VAGGLGLTAAAATAAVVVASAVTAPTATPNSPPAAAAAEPTARQILLMAATTAESRPTGSGMYWHIATSRTLPDGTTLVTNGMWTRRDGQSWISREPGKISKLPGRQPITLPGTNIGVDEIQKLPTTPDELRAMLLRHLTSRPDPASGMSTFRVLVDLLSLAPAPPDVRAAAFRALAALPHIKNLGRGRGGYILRMPFQMGFAERLVIDPKTTTVTTQTFEDSLGDGRQPVFGSTTTGAWTGRLPPYQVVALSQQKDYGIVCRWGKHTSPACSVTTHPPQAPGGN
jgi:hypothetical protein